MALDAVNAKQSQFSNAKSKIEDKLLKISGKPNCLRVRFLDEEGKTEKTVTVDEVDCSLAHVKNIHIMRNKSSSETSLLLRNPSLLKKRFGYLHTGYLSRSLDENCNDTVKNDNKPNKTVKSDTKDINFRKNIKVYSVNQGKTLAGDKKRPSISLPKLMSTKTQESKSILPAEVCFADGVAGNDITAKTIGKISRGLGKLLRRTNSVKISEPDPVYKVAYLGNVLTGWARGENCIEKPLATLWRNYQQSTKPDVVMKLSVTNSGLKGFTKEHGLTEYWSHRITYCASPPHYPKLFCWIYRHEGKKLKHELRCHAALCTKESVSKKITEELQMKLKQALLEFKKDRIMKQNARLSLANSLYDNPCVPRRKLLLSVGASNYRPPLERSKSAPKLGAIEELCSEEDEEEAETNIREQNNGFVSYITDQFTESILSHFDIGSMDPNISCESPQPEFKKCKLVSESRCMENVDVTKCLHETEVEANNNSTESKNDYNKQIVAQRNYLVTDSDDGSVSSGCETASTVTSSDAEMSSLPAQDVSDELNKNLIKDEDIVKENIELSKNFSTSLGVIDDLDVSSTEEVNHIPLGERNLLRRRSTYPPLGSEPNLSDFETKFESLIDKLIDEECFGSESFKNQGDNESACSDESGYSELLDHGKESVIGNTIMV